LLEELRHTGLCCNVQVVDDGSGEIEQARLHQIVSDWRKVDPHLLPLCSLHRNRGKGAAIRAGFEQSTDYAWIGFVDADGAVPAYEVCRLLQLAQESGLSNTALFGSRIRMAGRTIRRNLFRHLIGRVFATIVGIQITSDVYDSQCGLKLVPAAIYRRIQPWLREDGFAFDVELLAALRAAGVSIKEIPIDWVDQSGSKVSLLRDAWRMIGAVRRIKRRSRSWL
jgi:glycosyltransferase involved in cell wall biosynthesis